MFHTCRQDRHVLEHHVPRYRIIELIYACTHAPKIPGTGQSDVSVELNWHVHHSSAFTGVTCLIACIGCGSCC